MKVKIERVEHSDDGKTVTIYGRSQAGAEVVYSAPAGTMVNLYNENPDG